MMNPEEVTRLIVAERRVLVLERQMAEVLWILSALTAERPALQAAAGHERAVQ